MTSPQQQFISNWEKAAKSGERDQIEGLLAPNVKLISPVAFKPFTDRVYIVKVLMNVIDVIEGFHYTEKACLDNGKVIMFFEGRIDGKVIEGMDLFELNENGEVVSLKVMLRPFRVYGQFATKMAARLGVISFKMKLLGWLLR